MQPKTLSKHNLDSVFHSYDIRGRDPEELDEQFYEILGKAFVTFLKTKKIAVGHDFRKTSKPYARAFIRGATSMGATVVDLGEIATEMLYFTVGQDKTFDGGATVTASHNPSGWNGCKLVGKQVSSISGDHGLDEIKKLMLTNSFKPISDKPGEIIKKDIYPEFKEMIFEFLGDKEIPELKIVVDAGNGIGGKIFDYVFGDLPIKVTKLYFNPDDTYPNHVPNPIEVENVQDIIKTVKEQNADLGIAIDGDADRTFFIDKYGRNPNGLFTGVIFANYFLKQHLDATIVIDPRTTMPFDDLNKKFPDVNIVKSKAGPSHFRYNMKKYDAILGVEKSSHFYYKDFFFADSGMITIALMLRLITNGFNFEKELDSLYSVYKESGEVNYTVKNATKTLESVKEIISKNHPEATLEEIDGISFRTSTWAFNLRKSNTQPLVRLNVEGKDKQKVIQIFKEVESLINGKRDNMPALKEIR